MAYYGHSATDVCCKLAHYKNPETRKKHAIDALTVAIVYKRKDTFELLLALNTPMNQKGFLLIAPAHALQSIN